MTGVGTWVPPYLVDARDSEGNLVAAGDFGNNTRFQYTDAAGNACFTDCGGADQTRVSSYRHTHYYKTRVGANSKLNYEIDNHQITAALWLENQEYDESRDWHKIINPLITYTFDNTPYYVQRDQNLVTDTAKLSLQDQIEWYDFTVNLGIAKYIVNTELKDNLTGHTESNLDSNSDILPSIGLLYNVSDDLEIFTGYSENFASIKNAVIEESGSDLGNIAPETALNTDIGLRYNNGAVSLSAAVYHIKFENRLSRNSQRAADGGIDFLASGNGAFINDGGIVSKGLEASLSWNISDNWNLYSSLTLNDSEYTDSISDDFQGNTVVGSASELFVLNLSYDDGQYRAGWASKYTGERFGNKVNTEVLDSYILLDFYAGYRKDVDGGLFKSVDISVVISNITNTHYLGAVESEGNYFLGAARTATASISLNF